MLARPWPIKILFLCHLLAPVINVVFSSWMSGVPIADFMIFKWTKAPSFELFAMFALLPLAGIVIFFCKRWSYYAYLFIMIGVFYFNYSKWREYPHLFDLAYVITFFAVNLIVVGYFLIPTVRAVYFNERLRWWEAEPRYMVGLRGEILRVESVLPCEIENISRGGARLRLEEETVLPEAVTLRFSYAGESFAVNGHLRDIQGGMVSVEFDHSDESKEQIRRMIRDSFSKYFNSRNNAPPLLDSFFDWLHTLFKTGKGLIPPAAPEPVRKKKLKKAVGKSKRVKKAKKVK